MVATANPKAIWALLSNGVVAGSGIIYRVKMMKAELVMGINGAAIGTPRIRWRSKACARKPPSHANTSGRRPVAMLCTPIPEARMMAGTIQFHAPVACPMK